MTAAFHPADLRQKGAMAPADPRILSQTLTLSHQLIDVETRLANAPLLFRVPGNGVKLNLCKRGVTDNRH
jgi:hypothetical protein